MQNTFTSIRPVRELFGEIKTWIISDLIRVVVSKMIAFTLQLGQVYSIPSWKLCATKSHMFLLQPRKLSHGHQRSMMEFVLVTVYAPLVSLKALELNTNDANMPLTQRADWIHTDVCPDSCRGCPFGWRILVKLMGQCGQCQRFAFKLIRWTPVLEDRSHVRLWEHHVWHVVASPTLCWMPLQPFGVCLNMSVPFSANEAALDVVLLYTYGFVCISSISWQLCMLRFTCYFLRAAKLWGTWSETNQSQTVSTFTKAMHTSLHSIILHQVYKVVIDPAYNQALACCWSTCHSPPKFTRAGLTRSKDFI